MKILVIAPMEREKYNIENALKQAGSLRHTYTVRRGFVGKVYAGAATALALADEQFDMVAVIGYAAGSARLNKGDVVCPHEARYHDAVIPAGVTGVECLTGAYKLEGTDAVTLFTGDAFVGAAEIGSILERFGAECGLFDMEATAVCQIAAQKGVKVMVIKMVSDTPEKGCDANSFEQFVDSHTDFSQMVEILEKQQ